jgi:hypothetical protein
MKNIYIYIHTLDQLVARHRILIAIIGPRLARVGPGPASGKPNKFLAGPKQVGHGSSGSHLLSAPRNEVNMGSSITIIPPHKWHFTGP